MLRRPELWQHPGKHCAFGADKVDQCRWLEASAETAQSLDQRPVRYRSFAKFDAPAEEYRVLPTPASPPTQRVTGSPVRAESKAVCSRLSSAARPTKCEAATVPAMATSIALTASDWKTGSRWLITPLLARKAGWRWGWPAN